eukprot:5722934-Prorocentrum_lima.AAC.1
MKRVQRFEHFFETFRLLGEAASAGKCELQVTHALLRFAAASRLTHVLRTTPMILALPFAQ